MILQGKTLWFFKGSLPRYGEDIQENAKSTSKFRKNALMHELSIATSILDMAAATCKDQGCASVSSIRIKVGRASGVMIEPLKFAFDCAKENTLASEAALMIDEVRVGGVCLSCGSRFEAEESYVLTCPICDSKSLEINAGHELEIIELEVD